MKLSRATSLPWVASVWNWLIPGEPEMSGGLLALTRVFSTVGRSRVDSTLTLMPVFCVNAAVCIWKLASSLALQTVNTSMDETDVGVPLVLVLLPPQAANRAEAPLMLRPAAVARCKNWRLLMLFVVMYS